MADVLHHFRVKAPPSEVFRAFSTPAGLDAWWTRASSGEPAEGAEYELDFGPGYLWRAVVTRCEPDVRFELRMTDADEDWRGTRVGAELHAGDGVTHVRFHHAGWREANEHYRVSCFCWAMYLRLLKRHLEHGEAVPYEQRLDA